MIKNRIQDELKVAMKAGEKERVMTLRMILSGVKDLEIATRKDATDPDVVAVLRKGVKTRRDSIEAFRSGGREDLVAKEESEIKVIEAFLPAAASEVEIAAAVEAAIAETGASSPKEMGQVMKVAIEKLAGRAEGGDVSRIARERLATRA
jgi:hypothetical protein